jgi:hypothetical protein
MKGASIGAGWRNKDATDVATHLGKELLQQNGDGASAAWKKILYIDIYAL